MRVGASALCGAMVLSLAACGGGGTSSGIPNVATDAAGSKAPLGSTMAYRKGHTYVLGSDGLRVYPTSANGNAKPTRQYAPFWPAFNPNDLSHGPVDVDVAKEGTTYVLNRLTYSNWRMSVFYPGTKGTDAPEQVIDGPGNARAIALVGDGIDVGTDFSLLTYGYGTPDDPPPLRTLNVKYGATDGHAHAYAVNGNGDVYVAHYNTIDFYPAYASGNAPFTRSYPTPPGTIYLLAIAPDGTIYAAAQTPMSSGWTYTVSTETSDGQNRRIVARFGAQTHAGNETITGLSVDSAGFVYVGLNTSVAVFSPTASVMQTSQNGLVNPTPVHTVTNVVGAGAIVRALAIGP